MDEYAGGISENYKTNEEKLLKAKKLVKKLDKDIEKIKCEKPLEVLKYNELINRILVAKVVIEHLIYRKETRWKCYQERSDYPNLDNENWFKFVNSVYNQKENDIVIIQRDFQRVM